MEKLLSPSLLKPLLSLRRLVRLSACKGRRGKAQPAEILLVLKLFYELSQWAQVGDCLPRALVSHRFLTLVGMHPRLVEITPLEDNFAS